MKRSYTDGHGPKRSTLTLQDSLVAHNRTEAGDGGQGIGGVFNLGTLSMLATCLKHNHASTSNDGLFG
jgi:hypothetical protein